MTDSKQLLDDIMKNMTVRDTSVADPSVTLEELEQRAKIEAEEEPSRRLKKHTMRPTPKLLMRHMRVYWTTFSVNMGFQIERHSAPILPTKNRKRRSQNGAKSL